MMQSAQNETIVIPPSWQSVFCEPFEGVVLVVGGNDTGKSTLVRLLAENLVSSRRIALIDGDIGQTTAGPPTTQTLMIPGNGSKEMERYGWFVGGTSPAGHMLQTLVGLQRLVQQAKKRGAETIIVDTTGFIAPEAGGRALKWSKFDLLAPDMVIALQRKKELEPILLPWRKSGRFSLIELPASEKVRKRSSTRRKKLRRENFRRYFHDAESLALSLDKVGVTGNRPLQKEQLVGLLDEEGFLMALGIVTDLCDETLLLKTPLTSPLSVDMVRTGSLLLDEEMNERPIR